MSRIARICLILPVVVLLAAAPASQAQEKQDTKAPAPLAKNVAAPATSSLPPASASSDFRVGVNDVLDVHVWKEPELSRVVAIRPDGKISLPLAGEIEAVGHTALELRALISERLKNFVTQPEVTVIVQQINSQRYFIMGEVQHPGTYPLMVPTNVMQALAIAGGFREWADTSNITILRRTEDNRTLRLELSYKDWFKNKKQAEQLQLKNGDVIVVP